MHDRANILQTWVWHAILITCTLLKTYIVRRKFRSQTSDFWAIAAGQLVQHTLENRNGFMRAKCQGRRNTLCFSKVSRRTEGRRIESERRNQDEDGAGEGRRLRGDEYKAKQNTRKKTKTRPASRGPPAHLKSLESQIN